MTRSHWSALAIGLTSFAFLIFVTNSLQSCPFCPGPSLTLSQQVAEADAVVLVKWLSGRRPTLSEPGLTEFEVVEVVHQPDGSRLAARSKISLDRFNAAKSGDQFMLLGTQVESTIEWGSPLDVSKAAYDYLRNAPKPGTEPSQRLIYFLNFLESSDHRVADDAFAEFANAAYADVAKLAAELPRLKLRHWMTAKQTAPSRVGLYGMLLGLCGDEEDAKVLAAKIAESTDDVRMGIDGVMGGYLLLTGDKGLDLLDETKLQNQKAPFSETYAALQAVRFMWQYGDDRISRDRLRQSVRLLLDRPEFADLVIADLSRMKDWSIHDKLMTMYDDENSTSMIKRAIVRYMLSSVKDTGEKKSNNASNDRTDPISSTGTDSAQVPQHVLKAQQCLKELEAKDPKTVQQAKPLPLTRPRVGGVRD